MGSSQSQPGMAEVATQLPSAILEKAADLISKPGAWTQGGFGKTQDGTVLWTPDETCVCFCAAGAIKAVSGLGDRAYPIWKDWLDPITDGGTSIWNDADHRTQEDVVAKLREAAALAREQGQ